MQILLSPSSNFNTVGTVLPNHGWQGTADFARSLTIFSPCGRMTQARTLVSCFARHNAKAMFPYHTGRETECAEHITDVKKAMFTLEQLTKAPKESTGISTFYSASALDRGEWSTPLAGHFTPGNDATDIQSIIKNTHALLKSVYHTDCCGRL
jgi:hypothetical protein